MLNVNGVVFALVPVVLLLVALYWVVRLGVAAGIRSALPDVVKAASRADRGQGPDSPLS